MTGTMKVADFLMLRIPALPLSQMKEVRNAFDRDGTILRSETLQLPLVREALFLASERVYQMVYEPEKERDYDSKFEMSVARYLVRMSTRCTPFGAFASVNSVAIGDNTRLTIGSPEEMTRSVRIDAAVPWHLRDQLLTGSPDVIRKMRLVLNSSVWSAPDGLRYVETKGQDKARAYYTACIASTPAIQRVLDIVATEDKGNGILFDDLAARIAQDFERESETAEAFILGLVTSQLLVSMPLMAVTGDDVVHSMVRELIALDDKSEATAALRNAVTALEKVGSDVSANVEAYKAACASLKKVKPDVSQASAIQVDLFRPGKGLSLSSKFISQLQKQLQELQPVLSSPGTGLQTFHDRFKEKFGDEAIPLLQALDEDYGIAFTQDVWQRRAGIENPGIDHILDQMMEASRRGEKEIVLTAKDIAAFGKGADFPASILVGGMINAVDAKALDEGRFTFDMTIVGAITSATFAGRFCAGNEEIAAGTRRMISDVESDLGDTIYAEIAHLPEGRIGNVTVRPVLRNHEIVYLGRSGAPLDQQITPSDVLVQCVNNRVELFSRSRGKRIVPRLTNAHNFMAFSPLPIYRFLGLLQKQNEPMFGLVLKSIGQHLSFVPGIRYRNLRLTRPRWRLSQEEIQSIAKFEGDELSREFTQFLRGGEIKGVVRLIKADNFLQLDLSSRLDLKILKEECRRKNSIELEEVLETQPSIVTDFEGQGFNHELLITFTSHNALTRLPPASTPKKSENPAWFAPGQDWLYARIFASPQIVDKLVRDVFPAFQNLCQKHKCRVPFFVRYSENGHHLRLRAFGEDGSPWRALRNDLEALLAPYWRDRAVSRVEYATYFPETQRYGGPGSIGFAEQIFSLDSIMVAESLEGLHGLNDGQQQRFVLALVSVFHLLRSFDLGVDGEIALLEELKSYRQRQFTVSEYKLNENYRTMRSTVEGVIAGAFPGSNIIGKAVAKRQIEIESLVLELKRHIEERQLKAVIQSLIHMTANRIFQEGGSQQEAWLTHFLAKAMKSRDGREKFLARHRSQAEHQRACEPAAAL